MKSLLRLIDVVDGGHAARARTRRGAQKKNWHLGDRTLREGTKGHDVKVLQNFLTRAGVRTTPDGAFGRGTTKAVRAFERSQQRSVDGKVTRLDVLVLRDVVDQRRRGRQGRRHRRRAAQERRAAPAAEPVARRR